MKPRPCSIRIFGVLLAMVAMLACSTAAWSQSRCAGSFVLPFDAQWNGRTLPAGEYYFSLTSGSVSGILFIRDTHQKGRMIAMSKGVDHLGKDNALTLTKRNGTWHVSSLTLEPIGATLVYWLPASSKAEREMEASTQVIAVQIVGG